MTGKVLVACEMSGRVRDAFIRLGYEAISCDILPSLSDFGPHYQGDVRDLLSEDWDLVIGFPPCTDLSWANGKLIHDKRADGRVKQAVDFAELIFNSGRRAAIENPYRSDLQYWRKSDQMIHPWMFGDPYLKQTGLWLRELPTLIPDVPEQPEDVKYWIDVGKHKGSIRKYGRGGNRDSVKRSMTFQSIADAMAIQWSVIL